MPRRGHRRFVALRAACFIGLFGLLALACEERGQVSKESVPEATLSASPTTSSSATTSKKETRPISNIELVNAGQGLYAKYCALCHGAAGEGYVADNAPSLVTKTFLESASNSFLQRSIRVGRPNTAMAAYGRLRGGPLTEEDIRAIVAYVRSLGPEYKPLRGYTVNGDPKRGRDLFKVECMKCHGDESIHGNALTLHNPEFLASTSPAFLKYAVLNGRAPTPMPAFRDKLSDEQIDDIIAWLKGLTPHEPTPPVKRPQIPKDLPLVINPKGKPPSFQLRAELFVSAAQVKQALDQRRRLIVIDARSGADWIQFHIPGAVPIGYYETERLSKIPNDGTWVIAYCACPHHASGMVVQALRQKGFKHTAILDEGILEWRSRGYQLEGETIERERASGRPIAPQKPAPRKPTPQEPARAPATSRATAKATLPRPPPAKPR